MPTAGADAADTGSDASDVGSDAGSGASSSVNWNTPSANLASSGSSGLSGLGSIFGSGSTLNDAANGASSSVNWNTPNLTSAAQGAAASADGSNINWNNDLTAPGQSASTISKAVKAILGNSGNSNSSSGLLGSNPLATLGVLANGLVSYNTSQANKKSLAAQQAAQQQFNTNAYNSISNFTPLNRQLSVTPQTVGNLNNYGQAGYTGWNGQGGNQTFYNNVNPATYQIPAMKGGGKVKYATGGITEDNPNWSGAWRPGSISGSASPGDLATTMNGGTYIPATANQVLGQTPPPGYEGIASASPFAGARNSSNSASYGYVPSGSTMFNTPGPEAQVQTGPQAGQELWTPPSLETDQSFADVAGKVAGIFNPYMMAASMALNNGNKAGGHIKKNYATGGKVKYASGGNAEANPYAEILQNIMGSNQQQARAPQPMQSNPMHNQGPSLSSILSAMQQTGNTQTSTIDPNRANNPMSYGLNSQVYPQAQQATRIEAALSGQPYAKGGMAKAPKMKGIQISKTTQLTLPTTSSGLNPGLQPQIQTPPQGLQPAGIEGLPQGLAGGGLPKIMSNQVRPAGLPMEAMPNYIHPHLQGMMSNRMNPNNPSLNLSPLRMMATGGYLNGSDDGQADTIPAKLSDGEYILPSDIISHIGNGNNDAGARVVDKMIKNIRIHKNVNPPGVKGAKGKLPPKTKPIVEYIGKRRVKK